MKEIRVFDIPDFVHKKLKMAAVNHGIVLSAMAVKIIDENVDQYLAVVGENNETKPKKRKISKT